MAVSEQEISDGHADSSESAKHTDRKERILTKVVMRRLPPSMTKDLLINHISPLPDYDFMYFIKADLSLGEFAFSRAYINFKNATDIFIFKERFDNYVFLDVKGNEYPAVVEFAPFSHIPKRRNKKINPKCGTIESDPVFIDFVENLNKVPSETEEKHEYNLKPSIEEDKNVQNTPLLEYIKQKRLDRQKLKEEKREERKRREMERKRQKEEERKGRKRIEIATHAPSSAKPSSPANRSVAAAASAESGEPNKADAAKSKEKRMDDYRTKLGKPVKEYVDKRPVYPSNKDAHRPTDMKKPSLTKVRPRPLPDKEPRRHEYKSKRDDFVNKKRDDKEEKVEKKVKKYSERREERKNEMKRQEAKMEAAKEESRPDTESKPNTGTDVDHRDKAADKGPCDKPKEEMKPRAIADGDKPSELHKSDKDDPRSQRRIRNKDRPSLALYQPGMGLLRNRKQSGESADDQPRPAPLPVSCD